MKINLGSGYTKYPGFLNVDHDPLTNPDYLAGLEDLHLPIENNSVDHETIIIMKAIKDEPTSNSWIFYLPQAIRKS